MFVVNFLKSYEGFAEFVGAKILYALVLIRITAALVKKGELCR
jgi:hypothetical protein